MAFSPSSRTGSSGINAVRPGRTRMLNYDPSLVVAVTGLLLFGMVMVYSASVALADGPRFTSMGRHFFLIRHAAFMVIGLLIGGFLFTLSMATWQRLAIPAFGVALLLLVAVLIPGLGREVNGSWRWLQIAPGINLQASEVMKLAAVLYAADYTVRKQAHMDDILKGFVPLAVAIGAAGFLVLLE